MDSYEIIITPDAEADLFEIRDYIAYTLLAPDVALNYIRSIRNEIQKLTYMASSIAPVEREPWHSLFITFINFTDNYLKRILHNERRRPTKSSQPPSFISNFILLTCQFLILPQLLFRLRPQTLWYLDLDDHVLVAVDGRLFHRRDAFAFQADLAAGLGSFWDLADHTAV